MSMSKKEDKFFKLLFKLHPLVVHEIRRVAKETEGSVDFISRLRLINIDSFTSVLAKVVKDDHKLEVIQIIQDSIRVLNKKLEKLSKSESESKSYFLEHCKNIQLTLEEFDWLLDPSLALEKYLKQEGVRNELRFYSKKENVNPFKTGRKLPHPKHNQMREIMRRKGSWDIY